MWYYKENPITPEEVCPYKSFVYVITNTVNQKKYIGKKKTVFMRRKKLKNSKRRIKEYKTSDWEDYYGSSEALAKDIVRYGKNVFRREILHLCNSHTEASYLEIKEQLTRDVLLNPVEYYNAYVGCRLNRTHLIGRQKDDIG